MYCGSESKKIFDGWFLRNIRYHISNVPSCKFIPTENPYWLASLMSQRLTELDIRISSRNLLFAEVFEIIYFQVKYCPQTHFILDYAGGIWDSL